MVDLSGVCVSSPLGGLSFDHMCDLHPPHLSDYSSDNEPHDKIDKIVKAMQEHPNCDVEGYLKQKDPDGKNRDFMTTAMAVDFYLKDKQPYNNSILIKHCPIDLPTLVTASEGSALEAVQGMSKEISIYENKLYLISWIGTLASFTLTVINLSPAIAASWATSHALDLLCDNYQHKTEQLGEAAEKISDILCRINKHLVKNAIKSWFAVNSFNSGPANIGFYDKLAQIAWAQYGKYSIKSMEDLTSGKTDSILDNAIGMGGSTGSKALKSTIEVASDVLPLLLPMTSPLMLVGAQVGAEVAINEGLGYLFKDPNEPEDTNPPMCRVAMNFLAKSVAKTTMKGISDDYRSNEGARTAYDGIKTVIRKGFTYVLPQCSANKKH